MPLPIKIVFGWSAFFILIMLWLFVSAQLEDTFYLLIFQITGFFATLAMILLEVIAPLLLLIAIWKKYVWAWKYGAYYFGFFALNEVVFIALHPIHLSTSISILPAILLPIILNALFAIIFIKQRDYFEH